jgi:hypothetical protein
MARKWMTEEMSVAGDVGAALDMKKRIKKRKDKKVTA